MSEKRTHNHATSGRGTHFSDDNVQDVADLQEHATPSSIDLPSVDADEDANLQDAGATDITDAETPTESDAAQTASTITAHKTRRKGDVPEEYQKYFDVARYRRSEKRRSRISAIKIVAVVVVAIIMGIGVAAALYVSDINHRLTSDVTDELRQELVSSTEPGDPFYLLLLGIDKDQGRVEDTENYGEDDHSYRSDSIMLCRIDPKNVKVTMVSIHRDTLVNLDEYGPQKINSAYSLGGAAYATQVVSEFAGVPISHYGEIDLDRFISIVDVVGGVTVNLPVPVYDPDYTGLNLPAGEQTLNGLEAALLCRCRHGYDNYGDGDVFRAANQRMVFSEIIKKVMSSDPATIVATITTMADSVTTDLNLSQILDLAAQMQHIDINKDIMTGMEPTEGIYIEGSGWYEQCIVSEWNAMMNRVNQGLPPYDESHQDAAAGVAGSVGAGGKGTPAANATSSSATSSTHPTTNITKTNSGTEDTSEAPAHTYVEEEPPVYEEPPVATEYVEEITYYEPAPAQEGYYQEEAVVV